MQGLHRRPDDRLERLLEVKRLRDGLGNAGERLELPHTALCRLVQPCVLDRLGDLRGDRDEQVDLRVREGARLASAHVERALEPFVAGDDRHRQDRLVLVLGKVRELLEPRVEVRAGRDHDRRPFGGRGAGDSLTRAHARAPAHLLDRRAVGRAQDQLVGPLVVEVDEAGVGAERLGDLARDQLEHLLQVERRVDRRDGLREEPEMPGRLVDWSLAAQGASPVGGRSPALPGESPGNARDSTR